MSFVKDNVKYDHEKVVNALEDTYGIMVYQEQVTQILQELAGYTTGQADIIRRAISKKHLDEIEAERQSFVYGNEEKGIPGCINNGVDEKTAQTIYDKMVAFASYAFNKSHAFAYANTAYMCGALKYYYPAEYMCSVMNWNDKIEKLTEIIDDARNNGVEVVAPDINYSGLTNTVVDGKIVYGLSNIKGVGIAAETLISARNEKPFTSIIDFLLRGHEKTNSTQALIDAGAFDSLGYQRSLINLKSDHMTDIMASIKKIKQKKEIIRNTEMVLSVINNFNDVESLKQYIVDNNINFAIKKMPTEQQLIRKINNAEESITEEMQELESIDNDELMGKEISLDDLNKEKEVLGVYISKHPMSLYEKTGVDIIELDSEKSEVLTSGVITSIDFKKSKKNGKTNVFFVLEDKTSSIRCSLFSSTYEKLDKNVIDLLKIGQGIEVKAKIQEDEFNSTDDETVYQLTILEVNSELKSKSEIIELNFPGNLIQFIEKCEQLPEKMKKYENSVGAETAFFVGGYQYKLKAPMRVSRSVTNIIFD